MKAAINALTLALVQEENSDVPWSVADAMAFAEKFFTENADLFAAAPSISPLQAGTMVHAATEAVTRQVVADGEGRAPVLHVPVLGTDGLTDKQRAAVGTVGLCPNCHEPQNDHLPGCARASGEDPKARTKLPLSPST